MMPPNQSAAPSPSDTDETAERHDDHNGMDAVQTAVTAHLRSLGLQPEDLGSHSIRKGAATYCSSGSTHCPSSSAVSERAGWSNGAVFNTYLRYEAAGDAFVGRTITGPPIDSSEFAILPPHFKEADSSGMVTSAIEMLFPTLPMCMYGVAEFALASVLYHADFLRTNLQRNRPLWKSTLFQDEAMLNTLKSKVVCCMPKEARGRMEATGIPPHVHQYVHNDKVIASLEKIQREVLEFKQSSRGNQALAEGVSERRQVGFVPNESGQSAKDFFRQGLLENRDEFKAIIREVIMETGGEASGSQRDVQQRGPQASGHSVVETGRRSEERTVISQE